MGGLIQPTPVTEEPDSSGRTIAIAVAVVIIIAVVAAFLLRGKPKGASGPPAYATNLKLSDLRLSAEQNFVGATISYVDGIVTTQGTRRSRAWLWKWISKMKWDKSPSGRNFRCKS